MYPDEQTVEIDGEEVSYPGLVNGKFSSGDFADPSKKPSFIPAETVNLILDNLAELITACGGAPANVGTSQLVSILASAATANKAIQRDANGRAKVVDPSESLDIATKNYTDVQDAAHAALTTAHGAVSAATASKMVVRDANGRAQFASPSVNADVAIKSYVDAAVIPPIGFVYIQGAEDASPATLWPSATWSDVSSEEAGRYRRIKGTYSPPNGGSMGSSTVGATQGHAGQGHKHYLTNASFGNMDVVHKLDAGGSTYSLPAFTGNSSVVTTYAEDMLAGDYGTPQLDYETRPATVIVAKWRRTA